MVLQYTRYVGDKGLVYKYYIENRVYNNFKLVRLKE